jgi:hypothetical protein
MTPEMLEPIYCHWEEKLKTMTHLNNPKISVKFVRQNGIKVYPIDVRAYPIIKKVCIISPKS